MTAQAKECVCSSCNEVHEFQPISVEPISDLDRVKLFRKTVVEARYITGRVPVPNASQVGVPYHLNDPSALAVRYLHVAIFRKYFAGNRDKVFLPLVANSLAKILNELAPPNFVASVKADVKAFKHLPFSQAAILFLGDDMTNVSAADVVFENLYGHLLHADEIKVEKAHNRGPIVATFAAQIWLSHASHLVDKIDLFVGYVLELEKVNFDSTQVTSPCPSY